MFKNNKHVYNVNGTLLITMPLCRTQPGYLGEQLCFCVGDAHSEGLEIISLAY